MTTLFIQGYYSMLASYPGPEGGGKRAWYLLHAHVPTTQENLGCHKRSYAFSPSSYGLGYEIETAPI